MASLVCAVTCHPFSVFSLCPNTLFSPHLQKERCALCLRASVQDGAQEAAATSCGGGRHPAKQHPDLSQSLLPQRHGGGAEGRRRAPTPPTSARNPLTLLLLPFISLSFTCPSVEIRSGHQHQSQGPHQDHRQKAGSLLGRWLQHLCQSI